VSAQLGLLGGAVFEPDIVSAYRLHDGGVWSPLDSTERKISQAVSFYLLGEQFGNQDRHDLKRLWYGRALRRLIGVFFTPHVFLPREFLRAIGLVRTKVRGYPNAT
jgi:hypothetical protein